MIQKTTGFLVIAIFLVQGVYAQADWKKFNDTFNVYSISYPPNFELRVMDAQNIFVVAPLDSAGDTFQERVKFELSRAPQGFSLDSIAGLIQNQMKLSMKGNILMDSKIEEVKLGGQPAKKITGSGIMKGDETLVKIAVTVAIVKNALLRVSSLEAFDYKLQVLGFSGMSDGSLTPLEKVIATVKFK